MSVVCEVSIAQRLSLVVKQLILVLQIHRYFRNFFALITSLHFTHVLIDSTIFNTVYNYIMAGLIELKELSLTRIEIHMMFFGFLVCKKYNAQEKN